MLPVQTPTQPPATADTPTPHADLPPGIDQPTADRVLTYFLAGQDTTVTEIGERMAIDSARTGKQAVLSLRTIGLILDSPYARHIIAIIRRLADERAEIVAAEVRTEAIWVTRRIACNSTNDETARRAASALLRFKTVAPPAAPTRAHTPHDNGGCPHPINDPQRELAAPPSRARSAHQAPERPRIAASAQASSPATGGGGQLQAELEAGGGASAPKTPALPARASTRSVPNTQPTPRARDRPTTAAAA